MKPLLDIIIVTYNNAATVGGLLDSLPEALEGIASDVVVVDNGSSDSTVQLLRDRNDCKIVLSSNLGYSAGINRGVREASGAESILVLNPDTRLLKGCIAPLLDALHEPGTGIVAPRMLSSAGTLQFSLRRDPTLLRALGLTRMKFSMLSECIQEPTAYELPQVVDWATGAALMMTRECFDQLGGWDESFFLYGEEVDLSLRAREHGFATRYEPRSAVVHLEGGSGRSRKTHTMQAINSIRLYGRRHNRAATWCYFGLTLMKELSWVMRGHQERRFVVAALLRPSLRPAELNCSPRFLPGWRSPQLS